MKLKIYVPKYEWAQGDEFEVPDDITEAQWHILKDKAFRDYELKFNKKFKEHYRTDIPLEHFGIFRYSMHGAPKYRGKRGSVGDRGVKLRTALNDRRLSDEHDNEFFEVKFIKRLDEARKRLEADRERLSRLTVQEIPRMGLPKVYQLLKRGGIDEPQRIALEKYKSDLLDSMNLSRVRRGELFAAEVRDRLLSSSVPEISRSFPFILDVHPKAVAKFFGIERERAVRIRKDVKDYMLLAYGGSG